MANVAIVYKEFPVVMAHLRIMRILFVLEGFKEYGRRLSLSAGLIEFAAVSYLQTTLKLIGAILRCIRSFERDLIA